MHYFFVIQLLCGFFAAYVAGGKGRSRLAWWFAGALLPIFGVALVLLVPPAGEAGAAGPAGGSTPRQPVRPKRCCGRFIPDCLGCSYFRRNLFRSDASPGARGHCRYFGRDLVEGEEDGAGV
ncbi:MAG: hypothetical protein PVJ27_10080 [Candidatus Brocadiaceae bacterium]|jgi:hypothetical protein